MHRPFKMPGWPVRVDGKATRITSSPMLGEHTGQVPSEWLGLTAQAVEEMNREGVSWPETGGQDARYLTEPFGAAMVLG